MTNQLQQTMLLRPSISVPLVAHSRPNKVSPIQRAEVEDRDSSSNSTQLAVDLRLSNQLICLTLAGPQHQPLQLTHLTSCRVAVSPSPQQLPQHHRSILMICSQRHRRLHNLRECPIQWLPSQAWILEVHHLHRYLLS